MFTTYFNRPPAAGLDFSESPSMTEQHHAVENNINVIVQRALRSGIDPSLVRTFGKYADVTSVGDFMSAQMKYREGVEAFEALPSALRERFYNSPAELLTFLADKGNRAEAEKLGLIEKLPPPAPVSPEVVPDRSLDITGTTDTKPETGVVSQ